MKPPFTKATSIASKGDTKNAHSALCTSIRNTVVGRFVFSHLLQTDEGGGSAGPATSELQDHARGLALIHALDHPGPVEIVVENRQGLSRASLERWRDDLLDGIERSIVETGLPSRSPRIHVEVRTKAEPGLQVVDFITWATNRAQCKKPDERWFKRLKLRPFYTLKVQGGSQHGGVFDLAAGGVEVPNIVHPFLEPDEVMQAGFSSAVPCLQRLIDELEAVTRLVGVWNEGNKHFLPIIEETVCTWKSAPGECSSHLVLQIASCYVRAFDTIPLYHGLSEADVQNWESRLERRALARGLLAGRQAASTHLVDAIAKWRRLAGSTC